jgi:hypothetical protein
MLLAVDAHALETRSWGDKSALLKFVDSCDGGALILGEDAAQEVEFYSAIVHFNYAAQVQHPSPQATIRSWGIALISEGHGLKPQLLVMPNRTLVFGLNHDVFGISTEGRCQLFRHSFDSLFHAFLYLAKDRILLVRNEIGVVALAQNGDELWRFEKDVVTSFSVRDSEIVLGFMDTESVVLEISTGQPLR